MNIDFPHQLLLGHRGAPRIAHENTRDAFKAAIDAGLDGVECDLQQTSDGILVINHDLFLRDEPLASTTWTAAKRKAPWLLRLEQLLEFLDDYSDVFVNFELKTRFPASDGREGKLIELLASWRPDKLRRTWVSSFDPTALLRLQKGGIKVALGLIAGSADSLALLPSLPVQIVHLQDHLVTREMIEHHHAHGRYVFSWTVNDGDLARQHLEWKIDGLVGDDPDVLLKSRRSYTRRRKPSA